MKKKLLQKALFGFPTGIAIGFVITVIISAIIATGDFYPATPELIASAGNELSAVIIQTLLCGIMGSGFAMASVVWEIDSWSLAKQSGIYFVTVSVIMFPIAYITNRMQHSVAGFVSYFAVFAVIFVGVWIIQYFLWKKKIKKMNDSVKKTGMGN